MHAIDGFFKRTGPTQSPQQSCKHAQGRRDHSCSSSPLDTRTESIVLPQEFKQILVDFRQTDGPRCPGTRLFGRRQQSTAASHHTNRAYEANENAHASNEPSAQGSLHDSIIQSYRSTGAAQTHSRIQTPPLLCMAALRPGDIRWAAACALDLRAHPACCMTP